MAEGWPSLESLVLLGDDAVGDAPALGLQLLGNGTEIELAILAK
jgi:hypothetical protein